jgi:hypothetical protein
MLLNGMLKEPSGNQDEAEHGSSSSSSSSKKSSGKEIFVLLDSHDRVEVKRRYLRLKEVNLWVPDIILKSFRSAYPNIPIMPSILGVGEIYYEELSKQAPPLLKYQGVGLRTALLNIGFTPAEAASIQRNQVKFGVFTDPSGARKQLTWINCNTYNNSPGPDNEKENTMAVQLIWKNGQVNSQGVSSYLAQDGSPYKWGPLGPASLALEGERSATVLAAAFRGHKGRKKAVLKKASKARMLKGDQTKQEAMEPAKASDLDTQSAMIGLLGKLQRDNTDQSVEEYRVRWLAELSEEHSKEQDVYRQKIKAAEERAQKAESELSKLRLSCLDVEGMESKSFLEMNDKRKLNKAIQRAMRLHPGEVKGSFCVSGNEYWLIPKPYKDGDGAGKTQIKQRVGLLDAIKNRLRLGKEGGKVFLKRNKEELKEAAILARFHPKLQRLGPNETQSIMRGGGFNWTQMEFLSVAFNSYGQHYPLAPLRHVRALEHSDEIRCSQQLEVSLLTKHNEECPASVMVQDLAEIFASELDRAATQKLLLDRFRLLSDVASNVMSCALSQDKGGTVVKWSFRLIPVENCQSCDWVRLFCTFEQLRLHARSVSRGRPNAGGAQSL